MNCKKKKKVSVYIAATECCASTRHVLPSKHWGTIATNKVLPGPVTISQKVMAHKSTDASDNYNSSLKIGYSAERVRSRPSKPSYYDRRPDRKWQPKVVALYNQYLHETTDEENDVTKTSTIRWQNSVRFWGWGFQSGDFGHYRLLVGKDALILPTFRCSVPTLKAEPRHS
jgi:hypothetical protein